VAQRFHWLAPMDLWPLVMPLLPESSARPQGGGIQRAQDDAMFAAIVFVLMTGCPWREIPKVFGVSWQTAHRRFGQWTDHGLWTRLGGLGDDEELRYWASTISTAALQRCGPGQPEPADTAPNPAGRPGQRLRPRIERRISGAFFERLFGPRRSSADHKIT
jgi:transposase